MNDTEFQQFLLHGSAQASVKPQMVQAGPWKAAYVDGDLRYIKFHEHEAIRRIYAAIRDPNWNTIAGRRSNEMVEIDESSFQISYQSHHQQGNIDFVWQSTISGEPDGTISFEFDGVAKSDFYRNRIGYCILHPSEICSGRQAQAYYSDGRKAPLTFPRFVAANQPIAGFHDLTGLSHHVIDECWCSLSFEGDVFETEDQRNWIDASFKTYSTPLNLPRPALVKSGTRIQQKIVLRFEDRTDPPTPPASLISRSGTRQDEPVRIEFEKDAPKLVWPKIGTVLPDAATMDAPDTIRYVQRLQFDHLRVDANISDVPLSSELTRKINLAVQIKVPIELVIDLKDRPAAEQATYLNALSELLKSTHAKVSRIAVFGGPKPNVTSHQSLQMVRQHLQWIGAKIGGGSNTDLYQYQLDPIAMGIDFLCWAMNPQVHASDDYSLAETPIGAWDQTRGMHHIDNDMPMVISPITLKPRFNPVAVSDQPQVGQALPSSVDARQMSLLAAAWAVGMLKAVSESGCASATFFEAAGWRGFLEVNAGLSASELFPSQPGMLFPVFHLFEYIGQLARPLTVQSSCSSSREVVGVLLYSGDAGRLILANLSPKTQSISVAQGSWKQLAILDLEAIQRGLQNSTQAGFQFKNYRGSQISLSAYAVAVLKTG